MFKSQKSSSMIYGEMTIDQRDVEVNVNEWMYRRIRFSQYL